MKHRFSTFALWLLIAILPLNAVAMRFGCCWSSSEEVKIECEQHHGKAQLGEAPIVKHRALIGERCSHCSLCCAPTPTLPHDAITMPTASANAHAEAGSDLHHSSRIRDRLDRPPKSFLS